tara:strand:+ start:738 stop:965 length:228 start_codon:yes stop_codon:yes gene_type:complete
MARGKKVVKRREKVHSRKRMLGEKEVFPIRVVSRKEGNKYDFIGGFTREGRSDPVTVVDANGRPVPFKSIGNLVG